MKYINKYETEAEVQAAIDNGELLKPYVAYITSSDTIDWNSQSVDYSKKYLTFKILSDGNIIWKNTVFFQSGKIIFYSKDGGSTWNQITSSTADTSFNVTAGETIQFKGNNNSYDGYTKFDSTCQFELQGNIMSLIYGDDFIGKSVFPNSTSKNFDKLFYNCSGLTSAENLIFPATTLMDYCYRGMFYGCTSLTTAPELPATTLTNDCYKEMFRGCSVLTTTPELPATTLANNCYYQMFTNCSGLTTAPELPATTLAQSCYQGMFAGCKSLTTVPELPATTLANNCYYQMFNNCSRLNYIKCLATDISASNCTTSWVNGVSSTGTFIKDASMSSWTTGVNGIPSGWTVIEE